VCAGRAVRAAAPAGLLPPLLPQVLQQARLQVQVSHIQGNPAHHFKILMSFIWKIIYKKISVRKITLGEFFYLYTVKKDLSRSYCRFVEPKKLSKLSFLCIRICIYTAVVDRFQTSL
jgi:hypothetical protein